MSAAIDSHEMRKVVTVDIPGAYLQSKLHDDEEVFVERKNGRITLSDRPEEISTSYEVQQVKKRMLHLRAVEQIPLRHPTGSTSFLGRPIVVLGQPRIHTQPLRLVRYESRS